MRYLDQDTRDISLQFLRDGGTLDELAGKLHFDCEYLGRLLGLPTSQPVEPVAEGFDLWAVDRLDGVL